MFTGQGLSLDECSSAIKMVGNSMFGRICITAGESKTISKDSLPEALRQIKDQSLSLMVGAIKAGKEEGRMITLASGSTPRRDVGKFIGIGHWVRVMLIFCKSWKKRD